MTLWLGDIYHVRCRSFHFQLIVEVLIYSGTVAANTIKMLSYTVRGRRLVIVSNLIALFWFALNGMKYKQIAVNYVVLFMFICYYKN